MWSSTFPHMRRELDHDRDSRKTRERSASKAEPAPASRIRIFPPDLCAYSTTTSDAAPAGAAVRISTNVAGAGRLAYAFSAAGSPGTRFRRS